LNANATKDYKISKLLISTFFIIILLFNNTISAKDIASNCYKCDASFAKYQAMLCRSCSRQCDGKCCLCNAKNTTLFDIMLCNSCIFGKKNKCILCNVYFPISNAKQCQNCLEKRKHNGQ